MQHPNEKMIPIYIDNTLHYEIKMYALKTGKTMTEVLEPFIQEFKDSAKILVEELKNQESMKVMA